MKKICITTFCYWSNYGSIFQAIGLKTILDRLGFYSFIVQDEPKDKAKPIIGIPRGRQLLSKNGFRMILAYSIKEKTERLYRESQNFIDTNLNIKYYDNYASLKRDPPDGDYYLSGSDQIWNAKMCLPVCFLDFVTDARKKISYAASMGTPSIPTENVGKIQAYLQNYSHLSVREKDNAVIIKESTGLDCMVHIDPVFLLTKKEWTKYESPRIIKDPYVLVYALYWDRKYNQELKKLKKATGCKIVVVSSSLRPIYSDISLYDVTPREFLWLMNRAEFVVTSSFHGVAFSIIYNKRFSAIINPKSPSRINNILEVLNVDNLSISELPNRIVDYTETNNLIKREREKSELYLKGILLDE